MQNSSLLTPMGWQGRRTIRVFWVIFLAVLVFFASCSSAPKPPDSLVAVRNQAADQLDLAVQSLYQGNYGAAREFARSALLLSEGVDDRAGIAAALNTLGSVAARTGNRDRARALFATAAVEAGDAQRPDLGATARLNAADLEIVADDPSAAQTQLDAAAGLLGNETASNPRYLFSSARLAEKLGSTETAGQAYGRAYDQFIRQRDFRGAASARYYHASLVSRTGSPEEAMTLLAEALSLDQRMENPLGVISDLKALGLLSRRTGDEAAALRYFERALAAASSIGQEAQVAELLAIVADLGTTDWNEWNRDLPASEFRAAGSETSDL